MSIRIDKVLMTSQFESYKNYAEYAFDISISGSIPVDGKDFSNTIQYDRAGTITEVYYRLSTKDYWRPLLVLQRASDTANAEPIVPYLNYSSSSITAGLYVTNLTASPYTSASETWQFKVMVFDAPIAN